MKRFHINLFKFTRILEIIISIAILIAIVISLFTLGNGLFDFLKKPLEEEAFSEFLALAFNILIGIEFLKMIFKYNVGNVVEVLLFAIARQMIVGHTTSLDNLIAVVAIGILFAIRKFLFMPDLDDDKVVEKKDEKMKDK